MIWRLLILLLLFLLPSLNQGKFATKNYCCLSCGTRHVMCQYPDKYKIGKHCKNFKRISLDETKVLNLYNRMKSVKGVYAGGTDIMKMQWDYELTEMAQRWADQCPNTTDQCRDTARGKVNQIVDYIINEHFVPPAWESIFLKWYIQDIPRYVMESYFSGEWNALSQLIWSDTIRVGCAATSHQIHEGRMVTMVCNYAPPGNIDGKPVFNITGGMCTQCPEGSYCSDRLNVNLCVALHGLRHKPNGMTFCIFILLNYALLL